MIDIDLKGHLGSFYLDVAFNMADTGLLTLFGRSGSGKTSLLRAIAGLSPLAGHVIWADITWQDETFFVPVHQRRLGFLFQEASLFSHLSVKGNLDFAYRRRHAEVDYHDIVERLSLAPLLPRSIAHLSGGERQRVALARTLLSAPQLILMDEPLSSLDRGSKLDLLPHIQTLSQTLAIIYVSHDPFELDQLGGHKLHLENGRLSKPNRTGDDPLAGLNHDQIRALAMAALQS